MTLLYIYISNYVSVQQKSVFAHYVFAEHHGQEFVVGKMLDVSRNDVARFLF